MHNRKIPPSIFLRHRCAPATLPSTFDAAKDRASPATTPPSLRHLHHLPPPLGSVMTTTLQPLPPTHEPASALHLSSADFYFAMGTAVSSWAVSAPPVSTAAPPPLGAQCLETAIASGVSHLQRLLNTTPTPRHMPLAEIVAAIAQEAAIGQSIAAALFVRVFVDVLSVPTMKAAFDGLPLEVQQQWATDWAQLAHAAWRAHWYPELVARPTYAAGVLSGGWPCLFVAAAWVFDKATHAPGQPAADASTGPLLDPPTTWTLPARVAVMAPPNGLISDPMAYLRKFQALNNETPIPDALRQAVEEFIVTVIHHWLSTGSTPVAAWVSIPAQNPDQRLQTVTVFDHKPPVSAPPRPARIGQSAAGQPLLHEGRPIATVMSL